MIEQCKKVVRTPKPPANHTLAAVRIRNEIDSAGQRRKFVYDFGETDI